MVELFRSESLQGNGIAHGFTGRRGGVSGGILAGLNVGLGSDDDRVAVMENRRRAVEAIANQAVLVTLHQIHSADVLNVTEPVPLDTRPQMDAMVTDRPGLLLGALGADCPPILFADHHAQIIGAAHSGWKGAFLGVGAATVDAMVKLGADRACIKAAIGPCIAQKSYEVDDPFVRNFCKKNPDNERFFADGKPGHFQFDLEGFVAAGLAEAGLFHVDCMGLDTYADADSFYSYRRATHRGEPDYGRQMGAIALQH